MSQNVPVQPVLHQKHDPFSMWHMSLQLVGHGLSQLVPNTPDTLQPVFKYQEH